MDTSSGSSLTSSCNLYRDMGLILIFLEIFLRIRNVTEPNLLRKNLRKETKKRYAWRTCG